ncbi:MAG TPA: hypothetical protein VFC74_10230 [Oscillospiraceae bacterium]|nr:hypothetical protein [Oscillospiraceae bacterium]
MKSQITILEIALESNFAIATAYNWAKHPDFPKGVKAAYHQKTTYCRADVKAWLKKRYHREVLA